MNTSLSNYRQLSEDYLRIEQAIQSGDYPQVVLTATGGGFRNSHIATGGGKTEMCTITRIQYLDNHYKDQPGLEELAASIGLSEFHFQRIFTRWAGVSPKRFLQFLTREGAKDLLNRSENLLDTHASGRTFEPGPFT